MPTDWKEGGRYIARHFDVGKPPKELKGVTFVKNRESDMLLFDKSGVMSMLQQLEGNRIKIGGWGGRASKKFSHAFLYSLSSIEVEVPVEWGPAGTPPLFGIILLDVKISGSNPRRAMDRIAKKRGMAIDGLVISDIISEKMRGEEGRLFKDLNQGNIRDPKVDTKIRMQLGDWITPLLSGLGLEITQDPRIDWGETESEANQRKEMEAKWKQESAFARIEEGAGDFLLQEPLQKKLAREKARKLALERDIRDRKAIDAAKFERSEQRKEHEERLKTLEAKAEENRKNMENTSEILREEALRRSERKQDEEDERAKREKRVKDAKAEAEAQKEQLSVYELKQKLKQQQEDHSDERVVNLVKELDCSWKEAFEFVHGGKKISLPVNEFVTNQLDDLMSKTITDAEELDQNISELRKMLDKESTDTDKSYIWAGIAILHKARGAKGTLMQDALEESMSLYKRNPLAAKCMIDFLIGANKPKLVRGNYKPQYREVLEDIESALETLFDYSRSLTEADRSYYRARHKECLSQLSQDQVHGEHWAEKLSLNYG